MSLYFPFDDLGLRGNPFQSLSPAAWAEVAVLPEKILAAWTKGVDLMVIGEKGRGKTTTLLALARMADKAGASNRYERLPQGRKQYMSSPADLSVFFLDEAQRLNWRGKRQLIAVPRRVQLVVGSHADLSPVLTRVGRRPTTIFLDELDITRLAATLQRRLAYFSWEQPPRFHFADSAVRFLLDSYGSNQRAMQALLYEFFQSQPNPGAITAADLIALARQLARSGAGPGGLTS